MGGTLLRGRVWRALMGGLATVARHLREGCMGGNHEGGFWRWQGQGLGPIPAHAREYLLGHFLWADVT